MPAYTLTVRDAQEAVIRVHSADLPYDSAAFPAAGGLLDAHPAASHVEVFEGERAVLARHREAPVIRRVPEQLRGAAPAR